jgi:hypothetical protein
MSIGQRFRCDPGSFKVVNGRLMFFLNNLEVDAATLWDQGDETELLKKADENWADFTA